jgi:hypothetical protein
MIKKKLEICEIINIASPKFLLGVLEMEKHIQFPIMVSHAKERLLCFSLKNNNIILSIRKKDLT